MRKEVKKRIIKTSAIFQIFLMFSLTFAVAVLMSESVNAEDWTKATVIIDEEAFARQFGSTATPAVSNLPTQTNLIPVSYFSDESLLSRSFSNPVSGSGAAVVSTPTTSISSTNAISPSSPYGLRDSLFGNQDIGVSYDNAGSNIGTNTQTSTGGSSTTQKQITPSKVNLNGIAKDSKFYLNGETNKVLSVEGKQVTYADQSGVTHTKSLTDLQASGAVPAREAKLGGLITVRGGFAHLAEGFNYATLAVSAIQLIGGIAGLDKAITNSLTYAAVGGIMTGKLLGSLGTTGFGKGANLLGTGKTANFLTSGTGQLVVGAAVAVAIFALTYKKTETKKVNFQCLPWEAPSGGSKCEQCNNDLFRPCTEYRCKSLGQACELLNANTPQAQCAWVSRNDVESPKIIPSNAALYPEGLKYEPDTAIRPPAIGTKVKPIAATCLPAFTPLEFGFTTNEPAQCKIDYKHTNNFEEMTYYVGDDNYYSYNHTQKLRLPGPKNDSSNSIYIRNDGTMGLYTRCKDANGNENVDEYVFTFCVEAGPDTTPPVMEEFSLPSGSYVSYNADNVPIELYINEPATCKWSIQSKSYDDMENTMKCYDSPEQVNADLQYTCAGNVTGVKNMESNAYYFRCMDSAGNKNVNSKELILKGSQPLNIIKVLPNETVTGSTEYVSVDLELETSDGAEEGKAICYFSETGAANSYIQMFETDNFLHKQTLSLKNGLYGYYFRCVDYGGNFAENSTEFNIFVDKKAPVVTRVYKEDALKIVTDEDAMCSYSLSSCDFDIKDGEEMIYSNPDNLDRLYAEWKAGQTYHIKCQDGYGNVPSPNYCSIVVSSVELSKEE